MNFYIKYFQNKNNFTKFDQQYKFLKNLIITQKKVDYKKKRLLAIYDFSDLPYTHDITPFLVNAEVERRHLNLEKIDLILVSDSEYTNTLYQPNVNKHNIKQLLHNISFEIIKLFDTIGSVIIYDNRNQIIDFYKLFKRKYASIYPSDYNPHMPFERIPHRESYVHLPMSAVPYLYKDSSLNCLTPPKYQINVAKKWLKKNLSSNQIPITITLREWKEVQPKRSSKISEWQKTISYFGKHDKRVIFIVLRDYYSLYAKDNLVGENILYCNEAVISLSFRAALYQIATLNMFVTNGTAVTCWHNYMTNYIEFRHIIEGEGNTAPKFLKEILDMDYGNSWPGATLYQKIIWDNENFESIKNETTKALELFSQKDMLYSYLKEKEVNLPSTTNNLYSKKSLMSQRRPFKHYFFYYKLLKFFNILQSRFNLWKFKTINDIIINSNTKIIIYGAGSKTKKILPQLQSNIQCIIDQNATQIKEMNNIPVITCKELSQFQYDFIIITPFKREKLIIKELQKKYKIPRNKFLLLDKI